MPKSTPAAPADQPEPEAVEPAAPLLPGDWDTTLDQIARNASTPDAHDAVAALANAVTAQTTIDQLTDAMVDLSQVASCPDVRIQLAAQAARFRG